MKMRQRYRGIGLWIMTVISAIALLVIVPCLHVPFSGYADPFTPVKEAIDDQTSCPDGVDADIVLMFERAVVFTTPGERDAQLHFARDLLAQFGALDSAAPQPTVFIGFYPDAVDGGLEAELNAECAFDDYACLDAALEAGLASSYVGGMNLADAIDVAGLGVDDVSGPLTTECRRRYLILFTDGTPNEPTHTVLSPQTMAAEAAADARDAGITILGVYINLSPPPVDEAAATAFVLQEIASSAQTYFELTTPDAAATLAQQVADTLCKDCNGNGIMDSDPAESEVDVDEDGVLDVCGDCDDDGTADLWQMCLNPNGADCNSNGVPDTCDITDGTSDDCNGNGVPDECDPDANGNGTPDDCERGPKCVDSDRDGFCNDYDNCLADANSDQSDIDNDGYGDACDNCIDFANPDQSDADEDGAGDACDDCPENPDKTEPGLCGCGEGETDDDEDGVVDCVDNCLDVANPNQADANENGIGDACEEVPPIDPVPDPPAVDQPEPQPAPAATSRGGCGIYNGVGLIGLPLTMLLWMGIRVHAGRRRLF